MNQTLLTVTYKLRSDAASFKRNMEGAADRIGDADGLLWKIWGLDDQTMRGLSVYLFENSKAAMDFAEGPMIAGLRNHPDVTDVALEHATVDRRLSVLSGAAVALGVDPNSPA